MRILVTGAAGFVGRNLIEKLAQLNFEIVAIDNLNSTLYSSKIKEFNFNAIAKLEGDQLWAFRSSKPEESVKRETAWCMLQAIDGLRQELIKIMDNGKIAQNAIVKSQKN